jgi:hypothetical protein
VELSQKLRRRIEYGYHLGSLDASLKRHSLEGEGVSISHCPREWASITPLAGEGFLLTKAGAEFCDYHQFKQDKPWMARARKWAIEEGWAVLAWLYEVSSYDDEYEQDRASICEDAQEAKDEAEAYGGGIRRFRGLKPTPKLEEHLKTEGAGILGVTDDYVVALYVEANNPEVEGMWWEDDYDPSVLSAPRGVIFTRSLSGWGREAMNLNQMAEDYVGYQDEYLLSDQPAETVDGVES